MAYSVRLVGSPRPGPIARGICFAQCSHGREVRDGLTSLLIRDGCLDGVGLYHKAPRSWEVTSSPFVTPLLLAQITTACLTAPQCAQAERTGRLVIVVVVHPVWANSDHNKRVTLALMGIQATAGSVQGRTPFGASSWCQTMR